MIKSGKYLGFFRGWRVYVLDEHGTSTEASDRMIVMLVPLLSISLLFRFDVHFNNLNVHNNIDPP